MAETLYLISPQADNGLGYYTLHAFDRFGYPPAVLVPNLALPTIAAMVPDGFKIQICDESFNSADLDLRPDFVLITAMSNQLNRLHELSIHYRKHGCKVVIGGPAATLMPDSLRPYADVLVLGEIECIAGELFSDLKSGNFKDEYIGGKPDLSESPVPDWRGYPLDRALMGSIQTSRGCPFACDYCDVVQYVGRKQRHKASEQVVAEMEALSSHGIRSVFLADDNLTANRGKAMDLFTAIYEWNEKKPEYSMKFTTQLSIDAASDSQLLALARKAGLMQAFVGLETPNRESLKGVNKLHNLNVNVGEQVSKFVSNGISVEGGMMVGFDQDTRDIFRQQFDFAMSLPIPIFTCNILVAPFGTPLFLRMKREGRLRGEEAVGMRLLMSSTNFVPKGMSMDELTTGFQWLLNKLYDPINFGDRMENLIKTMTFSKRKHERKRSGQRLIDQNAWNLIRKLPQYGEPEKAMFRRVIQSTLGNPSVHFLAAAELLRYMEMRMAFERQGVWNPVLAEKQNPFC
ncbi:MAG: B12-binding domain-containing radical SAM protein [Holophagae bacterium]|nr:B12-binding domain-containing radical SAM protein [Holophagae bacterium]